MRQYFTPQELTDHFTMLPQEHVLLANKSGVNRLGFVVLFKYCQWEGRFPEHWQEVPRSLVRVAGKSVRKYTLRRYAFFCKEIEAKSAEFSTPS